MFNCILLIPAHWITIFIIECYFNYVPAHKTNYIDCVNAFNSLSLK